MDSLNQFMNEQPFVAGIIFLLIGGVIGAYAKDWISGLQRRLKGWFSRQNRNFAIRSLRKLEHERDVAKHLQKNLTAMHNFLWQITLYFFQSIIWVLLLLLFAGLWGSTQYRWMTNLAFGLAFGILLSTLRTINSALRGIQNVRDDRNLDEQIEQLRQRYGIPPDEYQEKTSG